LVGVVSARVYPPSNGAKLHLGYCNGTYTDAPTDYLYYDSLQRVDNVWYINGHAYTPPSTEEFDTVIAIALIAFVFAITGLSFAITRKRKNKQ
jgi:predicted membrane-bound mannosyltransferase